MQMEIDILKATIDVLKKDLGISLDELKNSEKLIVHSDRGCHYRWPGWIQRMEYTGLIRSMFEKGAHRTMLNAKAFSDI